VGEAQIIGKRGAMNKPVISQDLISILGSAFAGGVLVLLFQGRRVTWWKALLTLVSAEVCAFYLTTPLHNATGWNEGVIGLSIGYAAIFFLTGLLNLLTLFADRPAAFLRSIPVIRAFIGKGLPDDDDLDARR
jgi:hypothetical protein